MFSIKLQGTIEFQCFWWVSARYRATTLWLQTLGFGSMNMHNLGVLRHIHLEMSFQLPWDFSKRHSHGTHREDQLQPMRDQYPHMMSILNMGDPWTKEIQTEFRHVQRWTTCQTMVHMGHKMDGHGGTTGKTNWVVISSHRFSIYVSRRWTSCNEISAIHTDVGPRSRCVYSKCLRDSLLWAWFQNLWRFPAI